VGVVTERRIDARRFEGQPWDRSRDASAVDVNVSRAERWLSMVAGGALAAYGLKRRSTPGGAAALAGAVLLYRGATGRCNV
jgi:uncharacterized membrane protein